MLKIKEYVRASNLEQAYELNQKKGNRIIGGMLWLKMSRLAVNTAIDLSDLQLDTVTETEDSFSIGCMTTLRTLETHPALAAYTGKAATDALSSIVGVQFRNLATLGGSLYGRYGFSDVLTLFLALNAEVELYRAGRMPLVAYVSRPRDRDILVRVHVKKLPDFRCAYLSHRNSRTDFPVLACALSVSGSHGTIAVGARPHAARAVTFDAGTLAGGDPKLLHRTAEQLAAAFSYGSNLRGSAEYRAHLAQVLVERGLERLTQTAGKER